MSSSTDFFELLNARVRHAGDASETLWVSLLGYTVKMVFAGIRPAELVRINMSHFVIEPADEPDETLYVWEDELASLIDACPVPEEERFIHYHETPDYHLMLPGMLQRLSARDNAARVTYVCFERGHATPREFANKPFTVEIQWWLWEKYLLVHGAALGVDGVGALITAPSGQGKSTLALAGLVAGMEFISEDYVLVTRTGPLVGYRILNTGNLVSDALERMPEFKDGVLLYLEDRDKFVVDLTSYSGTFKDSLRLAALVYPIISDVAEPFIQPATSVRPFMASVVSTAKQVRACPTIADSVKVLMGRLKELPAYELHLSRDSEANVAALRAFLEE